MLLFLDGEIEEEERSDIQTHLAACPGCAAFVAEQQRLEAWMHQTWSEQSEEIRGDEEAVSFVSNVRERLAESKEGPASRPLSLQTVAGQRSVSWKRWLALTASAAAAALLFFWGFHAGQPAYEEPIEKPETSGDVAVIQEPSDEQTVEQTQKFTPYDTSPDAAFPPSLLEAERNRVRASLEEILIELAAVSSDRLASQFYERTEPLRQAGWQVKQMVQGILECDSGPALQTAIRLVGCESEFSRIPGIIPSLKNLLKTGRHPMEVLGALASLDDARADAVIGAALDDFTLRNAALERLAQRKSPVSAEQITQAVLASHDLKMQAPSPFVMTAVQKLSLMGPDGLDGLIRIWEKSASPAALARALMPVDPQVRRNLMKRLPDLKGARLQAGLRMAACLRLEEAVRILRAKAKDTYFRHEVPFLIAQVGGAISVKALFDMYQEPISMRDRRQISLAMATLFANHPEERAVTLEGALALIEVDSVDPELIEEDSREVLLEMLSQAGDRDSCLALAWLVEHRSDLATSASLAMARTGSRHALELLMEMLLGGRLPANAQSAAGAAAFHLGGPEVLNALYGGADGASVITGFDQTVAGSRRGLKKRYSLTDNRFEKLKEYITSYPDS